MSAADKPPLMFEARLGGLFPVNRTAQEAMQEIKGHVTVEIKGGRANQRRRSLYWCVAALVVPLLNERHGMTLDDQDLHDVTRIKLRLYDEIILPSGDVHRKLRSTSNRAMSEPERALFTERALGLWSVWTGIDCTTLRAEAEQHAA